MIHLKSHKKKFILLCLSLIFIVLGLNYYVKSTSTSFCYKDITLVPKTSVGIIFGAGIKGNQPSKYLKDRLDAGIQLYKNQHIQTLLLSGDNGRIDYDELSVMKLYCAQNGVDTNHIFLDYAGFDTYSTLYRAKAIFNVEQAVLVSQNYHLYRAIYIGRALGINCYGYAADRGTYTLKRKNELRESLAITKSVFDVHRGRIPKYLGKVVPITGASNYTKH